MHFKKKKKIFRKARNLISWCILKLIVLYCVSLYVILGQFTIKTKLQILSLKWKKRTFRWMQSSHVNPFAFRQNNWHFLTHPSINLLSLLIMTFNELATSCHLRTCVVGAGFKPRIMGIWVNPVRKLAVVSPSYFLLRHFDLREDHY